MATFGKASYNAAKYAAIRPNYPRQLYSLVFQYHERAQGARWDTAVDLGCGTGQATTELTPFRRIVGVDPSSRMIEKAREGITADALPGQLQYELSPAESLPFIKDGSVDLVVSAQAAHWFDWAKLWPEASRILRKEGSLAVWGYSEFRLTHYATATPLINAYSQGTDPKNSLGPHWERPGRTIVDNHLLDIPDPSSVVPGAFQDFTRIFFSGDHYPDLPSPRPVILKKKMTWDELLSYFRTFSSLHTFHEKYPEDLINPQGDIAIRFWNSLRDLVSEQDGKQHVGNDDEIEVEWPLALILARRT